jgi:hypothetical protein
MRRIVCAVMGEGRPPICKVIAQGEGQMQIALVENFYERKHRFQI